MQRSAFILICLQATVASPQTSADPMPLVATREEYIACLDQDDEIERNRLALARKDDDLKQLSVKFKIADEKLNGQVRQHAPTTKTEVESYNRAIDRRNQDVKDFNTRSRALQIEQNRFNTVVLEQNARCGSLAVDTEMKNLVAKERAARSAKP